MNAKSIEMLSCFFQQEHLYPASPGMFCGELFLHHLVTRASRDPRFNAIGLTFSEKYSAPVWQGEVGHKARMKFLGLVRQDPLMVSFDRSVDAQQFLLKHMYAARGQKVRTKDLWQGYPHPWPKP